MDKLNIKRIGNHNLQLPQRATDGSAGIDLSVCTSGERVTLDCKQVTFVDTGFAFEIPHGYVGIVSMRSSMAKHGLVIAQGIGVIDSDYRGEIMIPIYNRGQTQTIEHGQRIAQMIIVPALMSDVVERSELDGTNRGDGGFGSSG